MIWGKPPKPRRKPSEEDVLIAQKQLDEFECTFGFNIGVDPYDLALTHNDITTFKNPPFEVIREAYILAYNTANVGSFWEEDLERVKKELISKGVLPVRVTEEYNEAWYAKELGCDFVRFLYV